MCLDSKAKLLSSSNTQVAYASGALVRTRAMCCTIRAWVARTSFALKMSTPSTCESEQSEKSEAQKAGSGVGLRRMLMGHPLSKRSTATDVMERQDIDRHLSALSELLPELYGPSDACKQARMELESVIEMDGANSIECKRASLLFALARERELAMYLEANAPNTRDRSMVQDLRERVLPFTFPRFLRNLCQTPDSMVVLSCVLVEMWGGETLGNFEALAAHHEMTVSVLQDGCDGER